MTRYRALTRNSAPLDTDVYDREPVTGVNVIANPDFASAIGWGTGLYLNNVNDQQLPSERLMSAYSLRSDWLNNDPASSGGSYWKGDGPVRSARRHHYAYAALHDFAAVGNGGGARARGAFGSATRAPAAILGDTIVRYTSIRRVNSRRPIRPASMKA